MFARSRQGAPAKNAGGSSRWFSEGLSSETDPAGRERRREPPPDVGITGGVCGLDGSAVFGSSPQPSGLPEPAGKFHRGATRSELDAIGIGIVEEAST